ncbi:signal peptidase I [Gramella sp. GC03-9]|uniref:Signal peptidase I n=1 Tax=Christiangramia oceanisediminis TaxID=2920386 RepID=A0A9X2R9J0_9FLAO|nr:signal peptidase I [Gramella oceanisediminis]MCP9200902.1 signal peptidase I [Gramella oceanisediminis]
MTLTEWFLFFLIIQVVHFLGTWKLYQRAGRKAWEAAVPVYNAIILMKIINRPKWWVVLMFIPIVNLIIFPVVWVETIRSFGKHSTLDTWLVVLTLGFYIYYVNYATDAPYIVDRDLKPRTETGEWISSILFAVIAATIVHTYFMQPFTIPTSSLEKTLLVGDFLFVSKFHYGARTPKTAVSFPMVHDTIPVLGVKSYLKEPQIPYFRFPGFENVERNDIVVFNWPVDTVRKFFDTSGKHYDKPIDKKSNYVKRAVGIPGDSLSVRDGYVFINGEQLQLPERAKPQFSYIGQTKGQRFNPQNLYKLYDITDGFGYLENNGFFIQSLTEESYERFKSHPNVASIRRYVDSAGVKNSRIFPNDGKRNWNNHQFGPIYIPEEGKTVEITPESMAFYKEIIETYEGEEMGINNKLSINGTQVLLNGQPISSYTFKQNYYWMMGDNRNNSEDSRSWGYVPENHIVGKPVFIWMSWDSNASGFDKIRWDRVFTTVKGDGEPTSFLPYFLIALVIFFGWRYFKKRREA